MGIETWANVPIAEYNACYLISNHGRVKSLERIIYRRNRWHMTIKERLLKLQINKKGYVRVRLCNQMAARDFSVHTLVALAFVENMDKVNNVQVNHLDGVKTNNLYSNLEWVTNGENQRHAVLNGLRKGNVFNNKSKFSKKQVEEIRAKHEAGKSVTILANEYNVVYSTINRLVKNITYAKSKMHSQLF